eukprot:TRINITY_DN7595_c0_g1_i1.p1 TRINITY_DN7595_c0_g1~~TRINITY_DN7595_c0_g1_i1.p1  ORF type:complete len:245 (-),score=75.42 TRINITY_DN7595_c0_g1_i1:23-673(-)
MTERREKVGEEGEEVIVLEEKEGEQFGLYSWDSSLLLAEFVWYSRSLWPSSHVLEMGAGCGLAGLVAAKCGASVVLTDKNDPQILSNCARSVALNHLESKCRIEALEWGTDNSNLLNQIKVDFVLCSDCLYDSTDFEDFMGTVYEVLSIHPKAVVFVAYQIRSSQRSLRHLLLKWNLKMRPISLNEWLPIHRLFLFDHRFKTSFQLFELSLPQLPT